MTALLADDSLPVHKLLGEGLATAGLVVMEPRDGDAALPLARHHAFDIVLTDLDLPKIDSIKLATQQCHHPDDAKTPILAVLNNKASRKMKPSDRPGPQASFTRR